MKPRRLHSDTIFSISTFSFASAIRPGSFWQARGEVKVRTGETGNIQRSTFNIERSTRSISRRHGALRVCPGTQGAFPSDIWTRILAMSHRFARKRFGLRQSETLSRE